MATSPDGAWIASGSDDATVKIWHASDGTLARTLAIGGLLQVTAVAFDSQQHHSRCRLWRRLHPAVESHQWRLGSHHQPVLEWRLTNYLGKIASLSFSPNGQYLAAGSGDLYTRIWKVSDGTKYQSLGQEHRAAAERGLVARRHQGGHGQ